MSSHFLDLENCNYLRELDNKPGICKHLLVEPDRLHLGFMIIAHVFVTLTDLRKCCLEKIPRFFRKMVRFTNRIYLVSPTFCRPQPCETTNDNYLKKNPLLSAEG